RCGEPAQIKGTSPVGANPAYVYAMKAEPHGLRLRQAACAFVFLAAHRLRWASAIRLRVAALNVRLFLAPCELPRALTSVIHFGGRPGAPRCRQQVSLSLKLPLQGVPFRSGAPRASCEYPWRTSMARFVPLGE